MRRDEPGGSPVPEDGSLHARVAAARHAAVPLAQIRPSPFQPRRFFDMDALRGLAASIAEIGLLQDVLVRPVGETYELVLGERRWRASQLAGVATVSAKIVPLSDEEARRLAMVENVQRADLTAVEEALAFKGYVDEGAQAKEVGAALGGLQEHVAARLKVLNSQLYIDHLEQKVGDLQAALERTAAPSTNGTPYEAVLCDPEAALEHLRAGYEVVATLADNRLLLRRRAGGDL